MTEHLYKSVKALADELGISRTTLYKRAKLNGIELTGNYTSQQIEQLKGQINQLEKQLELAQMRLTAVNTMIDIAEKEYKLEIRKKSGPKQ
jgi:biotin operon repressor